MFTVQLSADVTAMWLVPMLGMALLSLLASGSGLLGMRWFRRGSLPLAHAILVVSLLIPLAAPLVWASVWAVGWSPIRLVAAAADPAPTSPPAMFEAHSPPQPHRHAVPTTKTDQQGNYELKFIRAGEQRIQTEPFWPDADQAPGKSTRTLTLKAGEEVEGIELVSQ